jgi:hypothetical protein
MKTSPTDSIHINNVIVAATDVLEPEAPGFHRRLKSSSNAREYNGENKNTKNVGTIRRRADRAKLEELIGSKT